MPQRGKIFVSGNLGPSLYFDLSKVVFLHSSEFINQLILQIQVTEKHYDLRYISNSVLESVLFPSRILK